MKSWVRLTFKLLLGVSGLCLGVLLYNTAVTPLDGPMFLSKDEETIIPTRVDWMCNCANFVDTTKFKTDPIVEPNTDDYFFIQASDPTLKWSRDHFIKNRYIKLIGRFYVDKGIPTDFTIGHIEDKPNHARVFQFDKIEYLTNN